MFIGEFEGLDESQSFIHVTANWEVIDSDLAEDTLAVNDEKASECHASFLLVDLVGLKLSKSLKLQILYLVLTRKCPRKRITLKSDLELLL